LNEKIKAFEQSSLEERLTKAIIRSILLNQRTILTVEDVRPKLIKDHQTHMTNSKVRKYL